MERIIEEDWQHHALSKAQRVFRALMDVGDTVIRPIRLDTTGKMQFWMPTSPVRVPGPSPDFSAFVFG